MGYCCLDLKPDSSVGKCLSHKTVAVIAAILQLIIWVLGLFSFIIKPCSLKETIPEMSTTAIAITINIFLITIGISTLLIVGLFKNKQGYIESYLIFNTVLTAILVILLLYYIFTQPKNLGFIGLFSYLFGILWNLLYFFIIRNYSLALVTPKEPSKEQSKEPTA